MATPRWLDRNLTHTCTIERDVGTAVSASGEPQSVGSAVATNQSCRFSETTERLATASEGFITRSINLILFPDDVDVQEQDKVYALEDSDDNTIAAGTFVVNHVLRRRGIRGDVYHVSAEVGRVKTT